MPTVQGPNVFLVNEDVPVSVKKMEAVLDRSGAVVGQIWSSGGTDLAQC